MEKLLNITKNSQNSLLNLTPDQKQKTILDMVSEIKNAKYEILKANELDIKFAKENNLSRSMIERLKLNDEKIESILKSLQDIANLKDPAGKILDGWTNHAGLGVQKVAIPIGVICVIYESRPNVTVEVASLCFKSSNAVVLKGGKEAQNSNLALVKCIHKALDKNKINKNVVTFLENFHRDDMMDLIKMDKYIDVIIPRGGSSLINLISKNSTIPVIKHDKGVCHIFVDESAKLDSSLQICINAKIQNPSACNAVETILIHESLVDSFFLDLTDEFKKLGVEIYGCKKSAQILDCKESSYETYDNEFLDLKVNIKIVENLDEALSHIREFSSDHSEAILSENITNIERFLNELNSACLYANASTRFSDGYELGFGAEIGISTNKLHARGPMGLDSLVTYKYKIIGNGQVRK
ncbi:glutamate-5-semialdehyde dehydrogenase [Campylobacter blaseri]|uniref:Gamma-glutamyl phosphate reductase n=1 Tax=Campylobacter blaseri TaxID=2042961 RepID=A0A2P8QYE9_9BACT|nr:glutamate-5-semialdehyde dehydrogenase [Campylobacter blaseri]PSM51278.1 glutamate-5-semialdehyde dehydrogenase [Campylobacter blaseri]PSM52422.1 glutamate-5-semialdehyde dehydrogenase [Campylobacter blaseri]QKF86249.1 glutamate-5-semialdehyde dehydrogenase [Campylobacter blaseri]